jgi:hypothetical protein
LLEELAQPNSGGVGGARHHVWWFRTVRPGPAKSNFATFVPKRILKPPARTLVMTIRSAHEHYYFALDSTAFFCAPLDGLAGGFAG